MSKRIVLAGAGSGGHLFPLLAVAEELKKQNQEPLEFLFLGPNGQMEKEIIGKAGIPMKTVQSGKLRRYFSLHYFVDIFKLPLGFFQALWHLFLFMPDIVFAKGGYASVPVVLAAKIFFIPVMIHESDAKPGLANRFLGSFANRIAISFARARIHFPASKTILTGVPIRPEVTGGDPAEARRILDIHKEIKPVIFVIGGSQGAMEINKKILKHLGILLKSYQIVHQTGKAHYQWAIREAQRKGFKIEHSDYYPIDFYGDEVRHYFALASVVISRSSATSIAEIAANQKPCILVPGQYSANNHQRMNAYELAQNEAAVVLEGENFSKNLLLFNLERLTQDQELIQKMKNNLKKFYFPDAAAKIAAEIMAIAK